MKNYSFDFYNSASLRSYNLNDTMKYQLSVINSLDPVTKKHSENVANLVCRICEYLKFNQRVIIHSTICAYLHDVGKMLIPAEILNKPSRLTDEEYEVMKTHTTLGYDICMKDIKLRPYAEAALYHHEALNGTGYPKGLTKKSIPYIAQVIRVADEYDAIVTKRQYKTHINISETLKLLIKDAKPEEHIKSVALDHLKEAQKLGKINSRILKVLFKVVIDDTLYEISCVMEYVDYLKNQIKRLDMALNYYNKMLKHKKEKDISYYKNGVLVLLEEGETLENFRDVLNEYKTALIERNNFIDNLYKEIKIIKKLRV